MAGGSDTRFPIPKYLLELERSDPQFAGIKAAFTPSFGVLVHVLLKRSQRDSGQSPANMKQKFAYTEKERIIFDEAWDVSSGFRDSLVSKSVVASPNIMELRKQGS